MADIAAIEARIWSILVPYRDRLEDSTIYGIPSVKWPGAKAHDYFAAVKAGKSYVSVYLLVADTFPDALAGTSAALLKRRTGKAAFTFPTLDEDMARELEAMIGRLFDRYAEGHGDSSRDHMTPVSRASLADQRPIVTPMSTADTLLPLGEVTGRLRLVGQNYVGMRTIPIDHIVGSVDRAVDFDRVFRPRNRRDLRQRLNSLREAFADRPLPPISVYEASDLYFVNDGHHRVALARADGAEFIDAEVTALRLSHQLHRGVDLLDLVHTEQNRQFMEQTGLAVHHPEAQIEFSRPIGYWELKDLIEAHAYEISAKRREFVSMPEATADWYDNCWVGAQAAIDATGLRQRYSFKTPGDLYLWVNQKLRELRTIDRSADWTAAAACRANEPVTKAHIEAVRRERRSPCRAWERRKRSALRRQGRCTTSSALDVTATI